MLLTIILVSFLQYDPSNKNPLLLLLAAFSGWYVMTMGAFPWML